MSKSIILVLMYHRHKLLDLIYSMLTKDCTIIIIIIIINLLIEAL
jgi:hypothetical protein